MRGDAWNDYSGQKSQAGGLIPSVSPRTRAARRGAGCAGALSSATFPRMVASAESSPNPLVDDAFIDLLLFAVVSRRRLRCADAAWPSI